MSNFGAEIRVGAHPVELCQLDQVQTYGGLLVGVPDNRMSDRIIKRACDFARSVHPVHLVEPIRRDQGPADDSVLSSAARLALGIDRRETLPKVQVRASSTGPRPLACAASATSDRQPG